MAQLQKSSFRTRCKAQRELESLEEGALWLELSLSFFIHSTLLKINSTVQLSRIYLRMAQSNNSSVVKQSLETFNYNYLRDL